MEGWNSGCGFFVSTRYFNLHNILTQIPILLHSVLSSSFAPVFVPSSGIASRRSSSKSLRLDFLSFTLISAPSQACHVPLLVDYRRLDDLDWYDSLSDRRIHTLEDNRGCKDPFNYSTLQTLLPPPSSPIPSSSTCIIHTYLPTYTKWSHPPSPRFLTQRPGSAQHPPCGTIHTAGSYL